MTMTELKCLFGVHDDRCASQHRLAIYNPFIGSNKSLTGSNNLSNEIQNVFRDTNNPSNGIKHVFRDTSNSSNGIQTVFRDANNSSNGAKNVLRDANNSSNGAKNVLRDANNSSNGAKNVLRDANNSSNGVKNVLRDANNSSNGAKNVLRDANNSSNGAKNVLRDTSNSLLGTSEGVPMKTAFFTSKRHVTKLAFMFRYQPILLYEIQLQLFLQTLIVCMMLKHHIISWSKNINSNNWFQRFSQVQLPFISGGYQL
ncbi:hypothetical protein QZH41_008002 [Actinostola sp. cb2023]|nr:hypothetical protein QZH41_008002 [Actinostola sp. cb2023]